LRSVLDVSITKLAGLWATWALIAFVYCLGRWYWRGQYLFAMDLLETARRSCSWAPFPMCCGSIACWWSRAMAPGISAQC
jgi:hypothetical protein